MMEWTDQFSSDRITALTVTLAIMVAALAAIAMRRRSHPEPRLTVETQSQPALRWHGWFLVTLTIRTTDNSAANIIAVEAVGHPKDIVEPATFDPQMLAADTSSVTWRDSPPTIAPRCLHLGLSPNAGPASPPMRIHLLVGPARAGMAIRRSLWLHWAWRADPGQPIRQQIDF